jgi:nitrite reductase/ring-hydroxylating ferredoxin subunit
MPALQTNSTSFNPNKLDLTLVTSYDRVIKANIERVWENVLDWEHLPHLHSSSFNHVDLDEAGEWGWRTWSNAGRTSHIELCVDETQYVARSYQAGDQISEIWTSLTPEKDQTNIHVEFYGTSIAADAIDKVGKIYLGLYQRLWDEDEAMMIERQRRLNQSRSAETRLDLGPRRDLENRLPLTIQLKGGEFQVVAINNKLIACSTICPHLLGPLSDIDSDDQTVTCPWHGYRFNIETGQCLSPQSASCKLPRPPAIVEESGHIILTYQEL